jgi:hypothetical protein
MPSGTTGSPRRRRKCIPTSFRASLISATARRFSSRAADSGLTYTFGLDAAGDPIRPWGHAELYAALTSIPDDPLRLGIDFIFDGALIRFAHGRTRTFSAGPYARFVADPDIPIDATHAPLLQPKTARMLLVYKALEQWASRPGSGALPSYYESKYDKYLDKMIMKFATAYNSQGGRAIEGDVRKWWYSGDFATADQGAEGAQQFDSNQFDVMPAGP